MLDKIERPSGLQTFGMYINGASVAAVNGKTMQSLDPYSGKPWAVVPDGARAGERCGQHSRIHRNEVCVCRIDGRRREPRSGLASYPVD